MIPPDSNNNRSDLAARALVVQAFQKTMRHFLQTQETVVHRIFSRRSELPIQPAVRGLRVSVPQHQVASVTVGRYVMKGEHVSIPVANPDQRLNGLYLVTGETGTIRDAVLEGLRQWGAVAEPVSTTWFKDSERWNATAKTLRDRHGPVRGIIHLAGVAAKTFPTTLDQWQTADRETIKSLFLLLQNCATDLRAGGCCLALSSLDGAFGRSNHEWQGASVTGAYSGLLKTVTLEWPLFGAKAIDLDTTAPDFVRSVVLAELLSPDAEQEIGYRAGTRFVFRAVSEPLPIADTMPEMGRSPTSEWVVLATGGARGITAETIVELAVPGMTLVLIGRAQEPAEEDTNTRDLADVPALRSALLQQAKATGHNLSPVQIEKQISAVLRDRAIRRNLEAFRQLGLRVEYHAADVRDPKQFGDIIDSLYARYGRIDAVLHGAGVIEDKLLADKALDSFSRVFDTKAVSTFVLAQKLRPETLQWLIFFTSVAGRTGNRGQCDYAAANELVNRYAWLLHHRWPHARVKAFNWGPWESGMASDEVNRQFRGRGVIPIPPKAGREFLVREMCDDPSGQVELIAGIFDFDRAQPVTSERFPFLQSKPRPVSDRSIEYEHVFSLQNEPYLGDHQIDAVPVVPAAAALELMAEVVQAGWPHLQVAETVGHRLLRGITLQAGAEKRVLVRTHVSSATTLTDVLIRAEIVDAIQPTLLFYGAKFVLRQQLQNPYFPPAPKPIAPAPYTASEAYDRHCFHGPCFRLIDAINGIDEARVHASATNSRLAGWVKNESSEGWLFNPGLVDAAVQAAIIWCRTHLGANLLPNHFAKVARFATPAHHTGPAHLFLTISSFNSTTIQSNWHWTDDHGRILIMAEGMEVTVSKALNRLVKSPPPMPILTLTQDRQTP
jgi:NAD(P)-dependent dehydrogenase (short-subunit alcohol dehydrogenase family)